MITHNDESDTLLIVYQRGFADGKQAAQRKPLSDEEIYSLADSLEIWNEDDEEWILDPNTFARAIEAAHNIKEQP